MPSRCFSHSACLAYLRIMALRRRHPISVERNGWALFLELCRAKVLALMYQAVRSAVLRHSYSGPTSVGYAYRSTKEHQEAHKGAIFGPSAPLSGFSIGGLYVCTAH